MFEFVIGSHLAPKQALNTLKSEYGEFNFPQVIAVENLMPRDVVSSVNSLFLDSNLKQNGKTKAEIKFQTFGHLMQFVSDMEFIAKLNKYERAIKLSSASNDKTEKSEAVQNALDEQEIKNTVKRGRKGEENNG